MALVPGVRPIIEIGGRVFTDLTNLIILQGQVEGGGLINCTLRRQSATSGYTPSGSKTFGIKAFLGRVMGTNAGDYWLTKYSDNDVGYMTSTALTNGVTIWRNMPIIYTTTVFENISQALDGTVPNTKYLTITSSLNASTDFVVFFYGYEE